MNRFQFEILFLGNKKSVMGVAAFSSGMSVEQRCGGSNIELCIAFTARWKSLREKATREGMKQTSAVVWGAGANVGGCRGQRYGKAAESEGLGMSSITSWNVIPGP